MPLVDEISSLKLDEPVQSPRFEASTLQVLQNIGQIIVQARTQTAFSSVRLSFEDEKKSPRTTAVNLELEEIAYVNRDLHLWFEAVTDSNLTIDIALRDSQGQHILVERWSLCYTPYAADAFVSSSPDSKASQAATAAIRAILNYTSVMPLYKWMQEAPMGGRSFVSQYGSLTENNVLQFVSHSAVESFSLPIVESMFGHFSLSVVHVRHIEPLLMKSGRYAIVISPSHTSSKVAQNKSPLSPNAAAARSPFLLQASSPPASSYGFLSAPSPFRLPPSPTKMPASPSIPIHSVRSQSMRIPGSLEKSKSADDVSGSSPSSYRGGMFSPSTSPYMLSTGNPFLGGGISDRLPCISPSELIGPFVGSFQESILSGHMSNTSSTTFPGFTADLGVSGKDFIPPHYRVPFPAVYYHIDHDTPYVGTVELEEEGYRVAQKGLIQLTVFNPMRVPVKTFLVKYDLTGMTPDTKTFLRQKIVTSTSPSVLRYAIHLRFMCKRRKHFYLYRNVRVVFPYRTPDEVEKLKIVYEAPADPKFFPCY